MPTKTTEELMGLVRKYRMKRWSSSRKSRRVRATVDRVKRDGR
jgi:hypothetical protein